MPIDPAISLGAKVPSVADTMAPLASMLAMRGTLQQQDMQRAALDARGQQQQDAQALRGVFGNPSNFDGGGRPNLDRLTPELYRASPTGATAILDQLQKGQTHGVETQQKQFDLAKSRITAMHGALSTLAQMPDLSQGHVISVAQQLIGNGMADQQGMLKALSTMPSDPGALRQWISQGLMSTQTAKDQLEAMQPDVQMVDSGGQITPYNRKQSAGPVGPLAGGATIAKTAPPMDPLAQQTKELQLGKARFEETDRNNAQQEKLASVQDSLAVIDKATNHPGLSGSVGKWGLVSGYIPGTKEKDFQSVLDQLKGESFLQAFSNLKGGGQITELEGKKATDAIARLDKSQTEPEFRKSLADLRAIMQRGADRLAAQQGGQTSSTSAPAGNSGGASGSWGDAPAVQAKPATSEWRPVKKINDRGALIEVDGAKYPVISRNANGSIMVKNPKTGEVGEVMP